MKQHWQKRIITSIITQAPSHNHHHTSTITQTQPHKNHHTNIITRIITQAPPHKHHTSIITQALSQIRIITQAPTTSIIRQASSHKDHHTSIITQASSHFSDMTWRRGHVPCGACTSAEASASLPNHPH